MRISPDNIVKLEPKQVFVYGSNKKGYHGAGAARKALDFGAIMGIGNGLQGNTYAIPTCSEPGMPLKLSEIEKFVNEFTYFAENVQSRQFLVTQIGCGIAGFKAEEIAPMFKRAAELENVYLPARFIEVLKNLKI